MPAIWISYECSYILNWSSMLNQYVRAVRLLRPASVISDGYCDYYNCLNSDIDSEDWITC